MKRIKSRLFISIQLFFLLLLALSILHAPDRACSYAALALQLWFEKMIPSLFPFMVLSGLIVRLDFGKLISFPVYPLLGRLYIISRTMCTTLLCGFLFGFPLGAKTIAEQYDLGQLSKPQAQYLLAFCNNIGPVYLLSFALPLLGLSANAGNPSAGPAVTAVFFGIPLLYGLVLRCTVYRNADLSPEPFSTRTPAGKKTFHLSKAEFSLAAASQSTQNTAEKISFTSALDASVTSACGAITRLGGYMVFFIVCNLLFEQAPAMMKNSAAKIFAVKLTALTSPILEITSGLSLSKDALSPALLMTLITFGGLSCFAQTYTCIRDTDLSFRNYCLHKLLQSAIAFCLYSLLFSAFSGRPFLLS